jgi:hypothetical protein
MSEASSASSIAETARECAPFLGHPLPDQTPEEQRADQGVDEFLVVEAGGKLTGFPPVGDDRGEGGPERSQALRRSS